MRPAKHLLNRISYENSKDNSTELRKLKKHIKDLQDKTALQDIQLDLLNTKITNLNIKVNDLEQRIETLEGI